MTGTPYNFVIPATEENIDIRLGSIGSIGCAAEEFSDKLSVAFFRKFGSLLMIHHRPGYTRIQTLRQKLPVKHLKLSNP